jgi:lytic murein transglycosylase
MAARARMAGMLVGAFAALATATGAAQAAACGNDGGGFESWKASFVPQASARGIRGAAIDALQSTSYNQATIRADRGQRSFRLSLDEFMKKRGASTIVSQGRKLRQQNAAMLDRIEQRYGVPSGVLLAIWGMETGFGRFLGDQHTLSAVATLAYDCRRSEFFTNQLYAALELIQRGMLNPAAKGAAHGEIGQTQFLPANVLRYAVDGDGDGRVDMVRSTADALASTANFLRGHGWRPGAGYQPGQPNFAAIQGWNAAGVYQQAIAIMGAQIDGG